MLEIKQTKKLIYILNHYSENSSQHFYHIINLLEEISDHDVQVNLIIEKADTTPLIERENIKVFTLKKKGILRLWELFMLITQFQRMGFRKVFVRISNFGACVAIITSFLRKTDVYYWHSGTIFGFDNDQKFSLTKLKWYFKTRLPFRFIIKFVTHFVTGPESMRDYYVDTVGVKNEKIMILYNDINTDRFKQLTHPERSLIRRELGLPLDENIILFVHKFSPVRKSTFYIRNFVQKVFNDESLSKTTFIFIGEGKDLPVVQQELSSLKLGKKVQFLGALPNAIVHKYYQTADIFINPTHAEGFPRVLIEAMACGLPIVTTNAGGIKDILGPSQRNYMSDISDSNDFAYNLIEMAKLSPENRQVLIDENLTVIQKYSTENVAKMYIKSLFNE